MSGSPQLTWHETFAYTCIQVLAEAYRDVSSIHNRYAHGKHLAESQLVMQQSLISFLAVMKKKSQLVANAMALSNTTARDQLLLDIRRGKRSQDLTMKFMSLRNYSTPVGRFTVTKGGEALRLYVGLACTLYLSRIKLSLP